ncbi:SMI1/KNR4 family protein [Yinghuangia sp. YIM S09857]|uniref:SMI1/KNR4 family protein n=1 Tax=Yinghuangia sp. YIM S09857 TaxID=3436929 RepID=UPI003F53A6B9
MNHMEQLVSLLGPAPRTHADPAHWEALERSLGLVLPGDFKEFIDGYGPCSLAEFLDVLHPAGATFNLGRFCREWIDLSQVCVNEDVPYVVGTAPGNVLPVGSTEHGDIVYFVLAEADPNAWPVGVAARSSEAVWFEFPMSFTEWLVRVLRGGAGMGFLPDDWPPDRLECIPESEFWSPAQDG